MDVRISWHQVIILNRQVSPATLISADAQQQTSYMSSKVFPLHTHYGLTLEVSDNGGMVGSSPALGPCSSPGSESSLSAYFCGTYAGGCFAMDLLSSLASPRGSITIDVDNTRASGNVVMALPPTSLQTSN
jgi:hypothetical protein